MGFYGLLWATIMPSVGLGLEECKIGQVEYWRSVGLEVCKSVSGQDWKSV